MARRTPVILFLLLLAPLCARGQALSTPADDEKGTYLGVLFSAVSEARAAELRGQGVLITHVFPGSPAANAELQRDDVLLQYDDDRLRDCEHFARLIRADRPGRKVKLVYLRDGREMTATATLTLGPVLQIVSARKPALRDAADVPRAAAKQSGPPAVSVACTPLPDGNVKLTIEYYPDNSGRPRTVVCAGSADEIDREVEKLPTRVQDLTRVALVRIRALGLQKGAQSSSTPAPKR